MEQEIWIAQSSFNSPLDSHLPLQILIENPNEKPSGYTQYFR